MINKLIVKKNFSKAVKSYEKYAAIQKDMAKYLSEKISKTLTECRDILEIGCGTGFLTDFLLLHYPNAVYDLVDISHEMIEFCLNKYTGHGNIKCIVDDGEKYFTPKKYNLITANACFQWFIQPQKTIPGYLDFLKKDGILSFATFGEETFKELHTSFKNAYQTMNQPYIRNQGQDFINIKEWNKILSNCEILSLEETKVTQYYVSVYAFLNSIKKIGAGNTMQGRTSAISLKAVKLMKELYTERFKTEQGIPVTYHIIYGVAKYNG